MSLRKSPTRTPALLAANRADAQKPTGPRTPEGKNRVALSALRDGVHAPDFLSTPAKSSRALEEFRGLYQALYAAVLPDRTDQAAMDLLQRAALEVWAIKHALTRWAASPAEREAWFGETNGVSRAGLAGAAFGLGAVGKGPEPPLVADGCWLARAAVEATRCGDRHRLDRASAAGLLQVGGGPRRNGATGDLQTKPEYVRKQRRNGNVIVPSPIWTGLTLPRGDRVEHRPLSLRPVALLPRHQKPQTSRPEAFQVQVNPKGEVRGERREAPGTTDPVARALRVG